MRYPLFVFFLCFTTWFATAQKQKQSTNDQIPINQTGSSTNGQVGQDPRSTSNKKAPKAPIDQYKIITLSKDTTFVDTSLTIQKEYNFNYLRKDTYGLLAFTNEGQPYTTLDFGINNFTAFPEFGFSGKHFSYVGVEDIDYYHVATPLTELYFKTVMEQGQCLETFITVNTSEQLNFAVSYKGLRSLGKYQNQLTSTGNFRLSSSYNTKNKRYLLKAHFTAQDISNGENGGIVNEVDFEGDLEDYKNRARIPVFSEDAESLLKGNRFFVDHSFRLNKDEKSFGGVVLHHQFNYERKNYDYSQTTINTTTTNDNGTNLTFSRYGDSYVLSNISDVTNYNRMYNKLGASYATKDFGSLTFFAEDFQFNHYYNRVLVLDEQTIPTSLSDQIMNLGGEYNYQVNKWKAHLLVSRSITDQNLNNIEANVRYRLDSINSFTFTYQNINKIANHSYNLFQSSYVSYNWSNNFKNEKINSIEAKATTKWFNASAQLTNISDFLYFSNDATDERQLILSPKQFGNSIKYVSVQASKEFNYGKFALDNTLLFQQVDQSEDILNVPSFVTRNTLYYTDRFFKKALFIQMGVTLNYFASYYANGYNPIVGDFYVQNQRKIGEFPMIDFFINAKIRTARIYLKAEHLNSSFGESNYYNAPNYPYRDFMIRFGVEWNFFQ